MSVCDVLKNGICTLSGRIFDYKLLVILAASRFIRGTSLGNTKGCQRRKLSLTIV